MKRLSIIAASAGLALCCVASAFAAPPSQYPNLETAQQLIDQSSGHIEAARKDHHDQFGGHAERALQLLQQAKDELREAAVYNERHR
ncbi:hypothetical protein [Paraburkholderia unamae]|jgi:hypothetical protein|uniref:Small metal-binding protein n=1 Tax=Paraburkholderia unamae TaxID=219649 RepID=A0ABX5KAG7_9BURK|nr:hypothetical protein [Paraburkholderia unamae]PVX72038.1 hypothetical protein C7402_12687 [Paraburkholderia unamae]RAR52475.1 hypothetical protein C7401_13285 [Paraburkholderia unamae]CAG9267174.1 conserved exported hypothetical protein [Paraburkholderia unamae]